jgi:hypothetical protein
VRAAAIARQLRRAQVNWDISRAGGEDRMIRVLFILQSAFSMWMFYDAIMHRRPTYWYFVIWLPFGEVVYFFMVKIHDPEMWRFKRVLSSSFERRPKIDELRFRLRETPCVANIVALAQGLHDSGEYVEAADHFRQALARDSESLAVLLGLGSCLVNTGDYGDAIAHLEKLIELKPNYHEYHGWALLAQAKWNTGDTSGALNTLRSLTHTSPRMAHVLLYARFLAQDGQRDVARSQVFTALEAYKHAPAFQRRTDRPWVREARKMLKELGNG